MDLQLDPLRVCELPPPPAVGGAVAATAAEEERADACIRAFESGREVRRAAVKGLMSLGTSGSDREGLRGRWCSDWRAGRCCLSHEGSPRLPLAAK